MIMAKTRILFASFILMALSSSVAAVGPIISNQNPNVYDLIQNEPDLSEV